MLKSGDQVPSFQLPDQDNKVWTLDMLVADGPAVVYFYPKDETPGCTAEACAFRDAFEDFSDAGARVFGVSSDSPESHQRFRERHRLPFTLLSDPDGHVASLFRVKRTFGLLPGRVTFVLDTDGKVRHSFSSQLFATKHVKEALKVLQTLAKAA